MGVARFETFAVKGADHGVLPALPKRDLAAVQHAKVSVEKLPLDPASGAAVHAGHVKPPFPSASRPMSADRPCCSARFSTGCG